MYNITFIDKDTEYLVRLLKVYLDSTQAWPTNVSDTVALLSIDYSETLLTFSPPNSINILGNHTTTEMINYLKLLLSKRGINIDEIS